jgi:hypothetical protein
VTTKHTLVTFRINNTITNTKHVHIVDTIMSMFTFRIEHSIVVEDVVGRGVLLQVEVFHGTVPYYGGCLGEILALKGGVEVEEEVCGCGMRGAGDGLKEEWRCERDRDRS